MCTRVCVWWVGVWVLAFFACALWIGQHALRPRSSHGAHTRLSSTCGPCAGSVCAQMKRHQTNLLNYNLFIRSAPIFPRSAGAGVPLCALPAAAVCADLLPACGCRWIPALAAPFGA